jgi:hypothetical protein
MTKIKVFYLILRYGAALAQVMYFQGKRQQESAGLGIYIASIALSGLAMYMTQNVCIYLSALGQTLIFRSCTVIIASCGAEVPDPRLRCAGTLIVVSALGSLSFVLSNCKGHFVITLVNH